MRLIYTLLFYLLTPLVFLRLYWKGFKTPEHRKRWKERLAVYQQKYPAHVIWIHAVSVGEAEAVFPLVKRLQQQYPSNQFLVTTTTPTGSARVKEVLADRVTHVYLPYDLPCVVNRFIAIFKPKVAVIMEKEIWPNLFLACTKKNIPVLIINARLSENSAKGYKKIPWLVKPVFDAGVQICTQTEEDRQQFIEIGANESTISVTGNLKFDLIVDDGFTKYAKEVKKQIFADRFVWLVASTHDKEEQIFFDMYSQLKKKIPGLLLLMVPRHPERFEQVRQLAEKIPLKTCMRSTKRPCTLETDVYIADTMGELKMLYGVADICFVGGSMVPVGGHNILEPAAMSAPIMFGPYMLNFKEIAQNVLDLKAAIQCENKQEIIETVIILYTDDEFRNEMTIKAKQFVNNNQGATELTAKIISKYI